MKTLRYTLLLIVLSLSGCAELTPYLEEGANAAGYNNQAQLVGAIKDALELSSARASTKLSAQGGYSKSDLYRIYLPENMQPLASNLRRFGLGDQLDRVEALMNQGAEKAAVEAKAVFVDAVRNMTVSDALSIVRGHDSAATDYFREQTEASLRARYMPIIQANLKQIGFYTQYQKFVKAYDKLPISNKPSLDLEQHVLERSLDGLFKQVAVEEGLIRKDPIGRGSILIGSVFKK